MGSRPTALDDALRRLEARRVVVVSEPGRLGPRSGRRWWRAAAADWRVDVVMLPEGEAAKRLGVIETAASELARLRVERDEPIVAIGGGALGDAAGFLAATYLRGVPVVHVPTTLVAQIDSSIGGKTAVDLPEGKNLVGAFHQPAAIVIDVGARSLPERQRRAALGEAVKMAALGDERLFELLEHDGPAIAGATRRPTTAARRRARRALRVGQGRGGRRRRARARRGRRRITLNLGHSLGHAVEAAAGFGTCSTARRSPTGCGRRAGSASPAEVTPPERAARIGGLLDALGLGVEPLPYALDAVLGHLATDKKHAGGRLRWVLPTADRGRDPQRRPRRRSSGRRPPRCSGRGAPR